MNKKDIVEYLNDNGIEDIEEIKSKGDTLVLKFYYYYEDAEIAAAENYALEESGDEEEEKWRNKFYSLVRKTSWSCTRGCKDVNYRRFDTFYN